MENNIKQRTYKILTSAFIIGSILSLISCSNRDIDLGEFKKIFKKFDIYGTSTNYGEENSRFSYRNFPGSFVYYPDKDNRNNSEVRLDADLQEFAPTFTNLYIDKRDYGSELSRDLKSYIPGLAFALEIDVEDKIKLVAKNGEDDYFKKSYNLDWQKSESFKDNFSDIKLAFGEQDGISYFPTSDLADSYRQITSANTELFLSRTTEHSGFGIWQNKNLSLKKGQEGLIIPFSFGYHANLSTFYRRFVKFRDIEKGGEIESIPHQNILTYRGRTFAVAVDKDLNQTNLLGNITINIHAQKENVLDKNKYTAVIIDSFYHADDSTKNYEIDGEPFSLRAEDVGFPQPKPEVQRTYFVAQNLQRSNTTSDQKNLSAAVYGRGELVSEVYGEDGSVIGGTWYFNENYINSSYTDINDVYTRDLYILGSFGASLVRENALKTTEEE